MSTPDATDGATESVAPVGHSAVQVNIAEQPAKAIGPAFALLLMVLLLAASVLSFVWAAQPTASDAVKGIGVIAGIVAAVLFFVTLLSLTIIQPGTTKVITFFGRYIGTVRRPGMYMVRPLAGHSKVSVRVRNFETSELKVNDADGNPVNIAAIVVWQVADTAKASFCVEDYEDFVHVQAEAALRHVATSHPYDNPDESTPSLRGATAQVSGEIAQEVAERIAIAGIEVIEARISKLAYAPEIAQAMLQRQQAGAIIAARERIVEGAVTMVESALSRLEEDSVVTLDDERRAAMVSNLLVVLCGESRATPVVNTGTLYT